jgi:hypothetical protein
MAVYEVVLRFQDRDEVRLTDCPLEVGRSLRINGVEWLVDRHEAQQDVGPVRYICVKSRRPPAEVSGP